MSRLGAVRFARYAYPPNELGYCGPTGAAAMLEEEATDEIERRAREFEGAWVYLELLAEAGGFRDPLAEEVVEAYWVGSDLLERVDPHILLATLAAKFAGQVGGVWDRVSAAAGALAHHSFHVFAVYPWFGLLGSGSDVPLSVLESCRIRWGTVVAIDGEHAVVRSQPLSWDGSALSLGAEREESVRWSDRGRSLQARLETGDQVSLHWDWVCERLSEDQVDELARCSARQLDVVNAYGRASVRG